MFTAGCCILCLSCRKFVVDKCRGIVFDLIVRRAAKKMSGGQV